MFSFTKHEKLRGDNVLENIITNGNSFTHYPYKSYWMKSDDQKSPIQVAFSVPKKNFYKAVHRNLLKRRIREAYRLNKHKYYTELNKKNCNIKLFIIYVGKDILKTYKLRESLLALMNELMKKVN